MIKTYKTAIYNLGNQLGLNNEELDYIMFGTNSETEKSSLSMGPFDYPGTHYGTISIKDF